MSFYSIAPFIKEFYPQYYSIETYPVSECAIIHKVDMEWGIFSNFGRTPIVVNGVTFRTSEQLFQLMKFKDEEPLKEIYFQKKNIISRFKIYCIILFSDISRLQIYTKINEL